MLKNSGSLPERPGVYIFRSASGKALYIGKAADLRKRVSQYFQKKGDPFLQRLLEQAAALETIVTESEADALVLESDLVHGNLPPFNIRLKDDKSFPYIEITLGEDFPGIRYSRRIAPGSFALGPLVDARKARSLIDAVTRIFRLRSCGDALFRKGIPCLYFHIERCSAPCAGKAGRGEYARQVADAVDLLRGRRGRVMARLRERMRSQAARLDFEGAQRTKEDLDLLGGFTLRSFIATRRRGDRDVIASGLLAREAFFAFLSVSGGRLVQSGYFHQPTLQESEEEALQEFLLEFYRLRPLPGEIIVSRPPAQASGLAALFSGRAGRRVLVHVARRGEKKRLLDLALKNLALYVQKSDYRALGDEAMKRLRLRNFPARIEGFDISHLGEKNRVGARVVFSNGRPEKRLYRNYLIRRAAAGDTEALKEVLERRFAGEDPVPDLLLIDGGLPQLGAARQIRDQFGLASDLVALAKGEERVFLEDGTSLVPGPGTPLRHLLQNIRDEVHRRAIAHHRRRRDALPATGGRRDVSSRRRREKI